MISLKDFQEILNKRLFDFELLEYRSGVGETDRLRVKDIHNNKKFIFDHHFDDLFEVGRNNALFTDRAKKFINELADESGIKIKFIYSQCIIEVTNASN